MKESNAVRKQRYIKGLYMYGIIPTLILLDEYEKKEDYKECALISEAIQERVDNMNRLAHEGDDFDVPRHISQINTKEEGYEFANEESFKTNVKHYVLAIKDMVSGELHSK